MPAKRAPHDHDDERSTERSTYRGHSIEVQRGAPHVKGERGSAERLLIDGKEIPLERTELGYLSHENMFKAYGSPFELAEDLIKQWGDAEIRLSHHPESSRGRKRHARDHPEEEDEG